jgi:hypothetical protein
LATGISEPTVSDGTLVEIVTARAAVAGLEGDFAGNSRAGFATAAARARPLRGRDYAISTLAVEFSRFRQENSRSVALWLYS